MSKKVTTRPFLKWAGGKKALLPELLKIIPKNYNRYFEPFLGSGALFFALEPKEAYLSDLNSELINSYQQIKRNVGGVIKFLKNMPYQKKYYYNIRSQRLSNNLRRAARFIYLNKTCWNGLYRVNPKGRFNVPIGRYDNPTICDEEKLKNVSKILKNVTIRGLDFEKAVKDTTEGDLIYLDPPYTTSHKNNGFIEYNSRIFSLKDQNRLKDAVVELDKKGCKIIMSNAEHDYIRRLYKNFNLTLVKRRSLIAGNVKKRKKVPELVITNF